MPNNTHHMQQIAHLYAKNITVDIKTLYLADIYDAMAEENEVEITNSLCDLYKRKVHQLTEPDPESNYIGNDYARKGLSAPKKSKTDKLPVYVFALMELNVNNFADAVKNNDPSMRNSSLANLKILTDQLEPPKKSVETTFNMPFFAKLFPK